MLCHFQTLSGKLLKQFHEQCLSEAKDFFADEMPTGKEWKRKPAGEHKQVLCSL
jgi:hypothetical protein